MLVKLIKGMNALKEGHKMRKADLLSTMMDEEKIKKIVKDNAIHPRVRLGLMEYLFDLNADEAITHKAVVSDLDKLLS